ALRGIAAAGVPREVEARRLLQQLERLRRCAGPGGIVAREEELLLRALEVVADRVVVREHPVVPGRAAELLLDDVPDGAVQLGASRLEDRLVSDLLDEPMLEGVVRDVA